MPFVVILLSPFAYLPVGWMALTFNLLKLALLVATAVMAVRLTLRPRRAHRGLGGHTGAAAGAGFRHGRHPARQHEHLRPRRGRGAPVALPPRAGLAAGGVPGAGRVLQDDPGASSAYTGCTSGAGRLLAGLAAALVMFVGVIPAAALGPRRLPEMMHGWLNNLIVPGLVKAAWYPIHINQSLPATEAGYLGVTTSTGQPPVEPRRRAVRSAARVDRAGQPGCAGCPLVAADPPGGHRPGGRLGHRRRRSPCDHGRRGLHYGIVLAMMLLLNQPSWTTTPATSWWRAAGADAGGLPGPPGPAAADHGGGRADRLHDLRMAPWRRPGRRGAGQGRGRPPGRVRQGVLVLPGRLDAVRGLRRELCREAEPYARPA